MGEQHLEIPAGAPLRHGHLLIDASFQLLSVNQTVCALLGHTEAALLGMSLRDIAPRDLHTQLLPMAGGALLRTCGHLRHRDGHHVPVEVSISALEAGIQRRYVVVLTDQGGQPADLTERVSHELNNTAQAMLGLLDDLRHRQRTQTPPSWQEVSVLTFVTRQLLSLGSVLQQRPDEQVERVELCPLVERTLEAARCSGELDGVAVFHLPPFRALHVLVNPEQVERVVLNLIRNAAQAMAGAPRKRLTIRYTSRDSWVRCEVLDTGEGLPAGLGASIFAPGVSTRDATARARGYGLSIARETVRACGGELLAESPPGGGACFAMRLPLCV